MSIFDRHERIALAYSGGKDSRACIELYRDRLDRVTVYHNDTGDLMPEIVDAVAEVESWVPHFVRVTTDVRSWQREHGLPTDLLPYSQHPIGRMMGEAAARLVPRYDCCWANLMFPLFDRVRSDGNTCLIRGTKLADMPRLPVGEGHVEFGVELHYPLLDWSHGQVFAYLELHEVKLPPVYLHQDCAPECARCSAWWGEGRNRYLFATYPELWRDYRANLEVVRDAITRPLMTLNRELEPLDERQHRLSGTA